MKFLEDIIVLIVFFEHLFIVVLGVTGTEGQETERFLGAMKSARRIMLFHSGKAGKECLEAYSYYWHDCIVNVHLQHTREEVFHLVYFVMFCLIF